MMQEAPSLLDGSQRRRHTIQALKSDRAPQLHKHNFGVAYKNKMQSTQIEHLEANRISGYLEKRSLNQWKVVYCHVESSRLVYSHADTRQVKGIIDFTQNKAQLSVPGKTEFKLTFCL